MKKRKINFPIIFISIMLAFLFATGIASWIISISSSFTLGEYSKEGELLSSIDTTSPTYDGNVHLPTLVENPTINFKDEKVFESYDFHFRKEGELAWTEITFLSPYEPFVFVNNAPMNAGNYEIKYTDSTGYEYVIDYNIKQATPTLSISPELSTVIYGKLPIITQPTGNVASYTLFDNSVEEFSGTFEYVDEEDARFNSDARNYSGSDTSTNVTTSLKFIPSNNNYESIEIDGEYTVDAVAYLNGNTPTYYCTIEKALEENISTGSVYVIPGKNPTIYEDIEIKSGVTLTLPYKDTLFGENDDTERITGNPNNNPSYARNYSSTYLMSNVTLQAGKKITVDGTFNIGGVMTGGGGAQAAGQTAGNYAQLTMGDQSIIECNGVIICYGYILESEVNNKSSLIMEENSKLTIPFIVQEHRGGTILSSMAHLSWGRPNIRTSPFNRFHFNNIDVKIIFKYNSVLIGKAGLATSKLIGDGVQPNTTLINILGPNNNTTPYLLSMKNNSTIEANYLHDTQIIDLDIYGDIVLNPLSITINYITNIDLSTEDVYIPISWYYDISLNKTTTNTNASVDLTNQKIKFLPGSKFVINKGVTVIANEITIFATIPEDKSSNGAVKYPTTYPTGNLAGTTIPGASFIVNGTIETSKLGGIVLTESEGAKIKITSSNLVETEEFVNEGPVYDSKKEYLKGYLYTSSGVSNIFTVIGAGEYESKMDSNNKCGWLANEISLSYDLNLGEESIVYKSGLSIRDGNNNITGYEIKGADYPSIENPQRDHYIFKGWSLDPNDDPNNITSYIGDFLYANTIFYAIWEPIEYNLTFDTNNYYNGIEYREDDNLQISDETLKQNYPATYNVEGRYPLPVPVLEGYKFGGWYTDYSEGSGYTNKITEIDGSLYSGNKTIYGVWNPDYVKEYKISFEIIYNEEILAKAVNSNLGFGDTTQNCFEETGVDFDLLSYINKLLTYNNSENELYYSVIYLVMPDETETSINIENSTIKITDSNTLDNTITFRIYQYDKLTITYMDETKFYAIPGDTTVTLPQGTITEYSLKNYFTSNLTVWFEKSNESPGLIGNNLKKYSFTKDVKLTAVEYILVTLNYNITSATVKTTVKNSLILSESYSEVSSIGSIQSSTTLKYWFADNTTLTFDAETTLDKVSTPPDITISSGNSVSFTITAKGENNSNPCFSSDTIIKTNNGDKYVYQIVANDLILSFNHITGQYEYVKIAALIYHGDKYYDVIKLKFDDGTNIEFINNHGLFDLTLNRYVDFTIDNYDSYINHTFIKYENGVNVSVKLIGVEIVNKKTGSYTLVSQGNINCIGNGLLNITSVLYGVYNIFEYDKNHNFDISKMQSDIEKYGLYNYSDFDDRISYKIFIDYGFKYFKVSIGKGYMTYNTVLYYIDWLHSCIDNGEAIIW